jgi:amylosucrase
MSAKSSLLAEVAVRAAAQLDEADDFIDRLARHGEVAVHHLSTLYGHRADFGGMVLDIFNVAIDAVAERSDELRLRDEQRRADPQWYQRADLVGAWAYVDRFSGDLAGLIDRIPYLEELGVTYLHLMPIFARPEGPNDGGYAVSDYQRVHPPLGTVTDLEKAAAALHERGMSLAVDFVFNHTAADHRWAVGARMGRIADRECYLTFDTEEDTHAYQPWLRAIFPDEKPGCFLYEPTMDRWVWSTFHDYQWDLNYRNPEVFRRMVGEMLYLANRGVDVLRLDAVPFIWKEPGTSCEGLPQAHIIIKAFNAIVRIAAPAMVFKSEAIVHPDEVRSYLGDDMAAGRECELAYNPLLMVEMWEALATGYTHLLRRSMAAHGAIPHRTAWVNYVRSHDDIGWGFANEDAVALGIDPDGHRAYLNAHYTGRTADSFARGVPFQFNPGTGDARVSGATASLAGLERALLDSDPAATELALRRILLIHGIFIATPGVPLLNLGDELATLNDPSYLYDPSLATDSRWIHRPRFDWHRAERRHQQGTIEARIHGSLSRMLALRTTIPALGGGNRYRPLDLGNDHVYAAVVGDEALVVLGNFSAQPQTVKVHGYFSDILTGQPTHETCTLEPYELRWLVPE